MIGFALIGCGMVSVNHIEAIKNIKNATLMGVYSDVVSQAVECAAKHNTRAYGSLDELLDDKTVNAVCICTPSGTHCELACKVMNAGKAAIVEKPLGISNEQCRLMLETSEKTGSLCASISQMIYSDTIQAVKKVLDDNILGKILLVNVIMKYHRDKSYYTSSPWRGTKAMDGGGALFNQGIHGIDVMRYLIGNAVIKSASVNTFVHNIEVEDTAAALVEFDRGGIGVIEGSTSISPGYPRRFEICGEYGSIIMTEDVIESWDVPGVENTIISNHKNFGFNNPHQLENHNHQKQLQNIANTLEGKEKLLYTAEQAAETVALIKEIYRVAGKDY